VVTMSASRGLPRVGELVVAMLLGSKGGMGNTASTRTSSVLPFVPAALPWPPDVYRSGHLVVVRSRIRAPDLVEGERLLENGLAIGVYYREGNRLRVPQAA
jgi:hypothetical protein